MTRRFLVSLAKPDPRIGGMDVYGKIRKFSKSGHSFVLTDPGEAKELSREFGAAGDIVVSEIPEAKGAKTVKYITPKLTPEERRAALVRDGWIEGRAGKWRKGL